MITTPLSTAPSTREQFLHDARAVADVVDVDLTAVARDSGLHWAVLQTLPEPHSGSATLLGAAIDGTTGRFVGLTDPRSTHFQPAIIREGQWRLLTALYEEAAETSGHYRWTEPTGSFGRRRLRNDIYDPFAHPAKVLCRFEPEVASRSPFRRVSVLPDGWEETVSDAVAAARRASMAQHARSSPAAHRELRSQLYSPYHLLFSTSVAALTRDLALDADTFNEIMDQRRGYSRAVLHYVTLCFGQYLGHERLTRSLTRAWEGDGEIDHRRAATLGLATAHYFAPQSATAFMPVARAAIAQDDDRYVQRGLQLIIRGERGN
jgi:hypothetical protein